MKRSIVAAILGLSLVGSVAYAQKPAGKPAAGKPGVKNYDFEADNIDGEIVKPEGDFSTVRGEVKKTSLIRERLDFIREIVKSADDI